MIDRPGALGALALLLLAACVPQQGPTAGSSPAAAAGRPLGPDNPADREGAERLAHTVSPAAAVCRYPDGEPVPAPTTLASASQSAGWRPRLYQIYGAMETGDLAVSEAALARRDAMVLALRCSPNDVFWSHLALAGLARLAPVDKGAAPMSQGLRRYRLTDRGRAEMPDLLRDLETGAR